MQLSELNTVAATRNEIRGNVNVTFDAESAPQCSEQWFMGDIGIQFVDLDANRELTMDIAHEVCLAKVITGSLSTPTRNSFCEPFGLQDTRLDSTTIQAGSNGARVALFFMNGDSNRITSMEQLQLSGPMADVFQWRLFSEQYGEITDAFDGADAYIGPGIHVLDGEGNEITYLNLWTAGKNVDLTTHNHGHQPSPNNPAFAETHLVLSNGTDRGGMYTCSEPGDPNRQRYPVPSGYEHGPFFDFDQKTGEPVLRENGAVQYPWHGWQAGNDENDGQAYDVVAAFETTVDYTKVT